MKGNAKHFTILAIMALLLSLTALGGGLLLADDDPNEGNTVVAVTIDESAFPGDNFTFRPKVLMVEEGTTVRWTQGQFHHTVTFTDSDVCLLGSGPPSQFTECPPKEGREVATTFKRTFDEAGVFGYYCSFHIQGGPGGVFGRNPMIGLVIVEEDQDGDD